MLRKTCNNNSDYTIIFTTLFMWQRRLGIYPIRHGNNLELLKSGTSFFDKLTHLIQIAEISIHLQIYIFEPDETGRIIQDLLIKAAQRGVKIYLVLDGYGSKNFSIEWQNNLNKSVKNCGF